MPRQGSTAQSWSPIRSTLGVSRLVRFGNEPARVQADLVQMLQSHDAHRSQDVQTLFKSGDKVLIQEGPFTGLEAIYQMKDGEGRVMVLIELMSKPAQLKLQTRHIKAS